MIETSKRGRGAALRPWGIVFAVACIAVLAPHAVANSLTLKFDGLYYGTNSLTVRTNVTGQQAFYAGVMKWHEQGNRSNTFLTVCTEVTQTVLQTSAFNVSALKDAPQPGSGMGEYRAGLIQDLYNRYWQYATASRTESAAFQLAVWEIAYEDDIEDGKLYALDVTAGDFKVTGGSVTQVKDGFNDSARDLANIWLSNLTSVDVTTLVALTSPYGQDQIIIIPLPPAVLMAGLGLVICGVARRRMNPAA